MWRRATGTCWGMKKKSLPEIPRHGKFVWLRGLDLNQRPLGYEWQYKRGFSELQGPIGSLK
jgi:hypothetical protein